MTLHEELKSAVKTVNFVNLKPHSEAIQRVRLPKQCGRAGMVLLKSLPCYIRDGYWRARTIGQA